MVARRYEIYLREYSTRYLTKPTNNEVFDDFPKISNHFPKIFKMLSGGHTNLSEHFPNF